MKISFADFWPGFDYNYNFITFLFKEVFEDISVSNPEDCDCLIYNIFGQSHRSYNDCIKIFFNGESSPRPNFNECDYSITSFFDSYDSKNIRIPLWMFYVDWFNTGTWGNPGWLIPVDYLTGENPFFLKEKTKFCSTVFSIPYQNRIDMIDMVNRYKDVDCYGKCHKMQIPQNNSHAGEFEKMEVISDYKFSICFENAAPGGWYTEKLLHAKIAGNIPIYYSDTECHKDFNTKGFLNLSDYSDMESMLEDIVKIDNDNNLYQSILKEPLFQKRPTLDSVFEQMTGVLT